MTTDAQKREMEREFYAQIPKARASDPFFQSVFAFMYDAHLHAGPGKEVLNIFTSQDFSGNREEVYRTHFFNECNLTSVDFWHDTFIKDGVPEKENIKLPYPDHSFDVLVTTKYVIEHVTDPFKLMREIHRVLKPGGIGYIVAAHVRRQHQKPYDFFRFTEFALEHLAKVSGFSSWEVKPTDGAFYSLAMYSYFFQRSITMPKWLEGLCDWWFQYVRTPLGFFLHRHDNGYGRDLSSYFTLKVTK